ncbi:MAG: hypothetical protein ACK5XD_09995, partial [Acidobacteriota bacterium]
MSQPILWSRPLDDEFDDLALDDQYVELASEIREYAEDDYDDELSERERREVTIALAPAPPPPPPAPAPPDPTPKSSSRPPTPPPPP